MIVPEQPRNDAATRPRAMRDYIDRTILTVQQHFTTIDSTVWPDWANTLADEILYLREDVSRLVEAAEQAQRERPKHSIGGTMQLMAYEKAPITVGAIRFETNNDDGTHIEELTAFIRSRTHGSASHDGTRIYIHQAHGTQTALVGDWIVMEGTNTFRVVVDDEFALTHEPSGATYGPA